MNIKRRPLAPLKLPVEVQDTLDRACKDHRIGVGAFVAAAVMEKLGYPKDEARAAVALCYPKGGR